MGSETKYECGVCRDLRTDDNGNECRACAPADPHAPTPAADGEADFEGAVRREMESLLAYAQRADVMASNVAAAVDHSVRKISALRARPLPDDVQAAVSRCLKWEHHLRSGFNPALVRESRESLASDLRTLLAHLQRTEG